MNTSVKKIVKNVAVGVIAVAAIAVLVWAFIYWDVWELMKDPERLGHLVEQAGPWGPLVFIALQFAQVLFAPIPGNVTTLVGGLIFGFYKAMLFSLIAVTLGSMAAFGLSRCLGLKLVNRWMGEEKVQHYQKLVEGKQTSALFIMFLMPFFPDDLLCFVAGLTDMSWKRFGLLCLVTRPWGLVASALLGSQATSMSIPMLVVCGLLRVAVAVVGMIYGPRFEARITRWMQQRSRQSIAEKEKDHGSNGNSGEINRS